MEHCLWEISGRTQKRVLSNVSGGPVRGWTPGRKRVLLGGDTEKGGEAQMLLLEEVREKQAPCWVERGDKPKSGNGDHGQEA